MNLARKLSDVARRCGNRPAIIFENAVHAFDDLDREVERYSAMLARLNVKTGGPRSHSAAQADGVYFPGIGDSVRWRNSAAAQYRL